MVTSSALVHALHTHFGFSAFRPLQEDIIQTILKGQDALVIMPTGGGKSICFQLPAILMDGMAIVVSPLISLMEDQIRALRQKNIPAAALHSGTSQRDNNQIFQQMHEGALKLLYVSPERAVTNVFQESIKRLRVSLIAIDEAHCVSIWGNDFRPEYGQLTTLTTLFPHIPVIALTATADKATQDDIRDKLKLRIADIFLSSFERPNIHLQVRPGVERLEQILEFLYQHSGESGIIYCLARKTTELIAEKLRYKGFLAQAYHADMSPSARKKVQEDFQQDKVRLVCATIAFGMGIDKPNIRWVIHYNLPKNIESYYQEIGRAGRDQLPAEALLFYSFRDLDVYRNFIEVSDANETFKRVQTEKLERIWEYSQALYCRTNVILHYFGEYRDARCGHCDLCTKPPVGFDGTTLTQMALSACKRTNETVGVQMLIDVLRGSGRKEVLDRGLNQIKTYGAGRDTSAKDWAQYITQIIHQGYLSIDYTAFSVLRCTPLSDEVLFNGKKVILHRQQDQAWEPVVVKEPKTKRLTNDLLSILEKLTRDLAAEEGVGEYVIFPAGTLKQIAQLRPYTLGAFMEIKGVGEYKAKKYGERFLDAIRKYLSEQTHVKKAKGATYIETIKLYNEGKSLEEIAQTREMSVSTIAGHLARMYEKGEAIDFSSILSEGDLALARQAWRASGYSDLVNQVKAEVGDSLDFARLNIALAVLRVERGRTTK